MSDVLTYDDLTSVLSPRLAKSVPVSVIDNINTMLADPDMGEAYRDNIIGYQNILNEGRFKLQSYVDAVKYVSHKLRNLNNKEAYALTFPDKIADWDRRGVSNKDRDTYIHVYHHSKLVTLILEQSIIPTWIVNQDLYQEALNTQAHLMRDAKSEMVKHLASKTILEILKKPEAAELKVDIGVRENSVIESVRNSVEELVKLQRDQILRGVTTAVDVAEQRLAIEGEFEHV